MTVEKKLYAVVTEKKARDARGRLIWVYNGITHMHALDIANARMIYRQSDPKMLTRIVACGPVLGYFVDDNHGEKLSA